MDSGGHSRQMGWFADPKYTHEENVEYCENQTLKFTKRRALAVHVTVTPRARGPERAAR